MTVVVFGQRAYGRVLSQGGEHAETVFFHIQFVPLFPIQSRWVMYDDGAGQRSGFDTTLNLRSVAATYLRVWAPIAAIAAGASLATPGLVLAAVLGALSAWSWTWRDRGGGHAQRRSDMDRLAFGHRCDPELLEHSEHERLTILLSSRLTRRADPRPPDDVARFGAHDVDEAVAAYGLLRLSKHRDSRTAADQLMARSFEAMPSDGGPFRAGAPSPGDQAAIANAIRAEIATENLRRRRWLARRPRRWYQRPVVQALGLAGATFSMVGATGASVRPATVVTDRELDEILIPHGRVKVMCDEAPALAVERTGLRACMLGARVLPLDSPSLEPLTDRTVYGRLQRRAYKTINGATNSQPYGYMLQVEQPMEYWRQASGPLAIDALLLLCWGLWARAIVRRRAERRELEAAA